LGWLTAWEKIHSGPSSLMARGKYGKKTTIWKSYGMCVVKCKYYAPSNPRTSLQQANRSQFSQCMSSWVSLSSEDKAKWAKIQKRVRCYRHLTPQAVFMKKCMLGHPLDPTPWWEENGP